MPKIVEYTANMMSEDDLALLEADIAGCNYIWHSKPDIRDGSPTIMWTMDWVPLTKFEVNNIPRTAALHKSFESESLEGIAEAKEAWMESMAKDCELAVFLCLDYGIKQGVEVQSGEYICHLSASFVVLGKRA